MVVSEERGDISVAHRGEIWRVDATGLSTALQRHAEGKASWGRRQVPRTPWYVHGGRAVLATALASFMWIAAVPGATVATREYRVPVTVENLPEGLSVDSIPEVLVEVSGPQRVLLLTSEKDIRPAVDATDAGPGLERHFLRHASVELPRELEVKRIEPQRVELALRPAS